MSLIHSSDTLFKRDRWIPNCSASIPTAFEYDVDKNRLSESIAFAEDFEQEFARTLDRRGIAWQYKPRTFAVEWDEDGNFHRQFHTELFPAGPRLIPRPCGAWQPLNN